MSKNTANATWEGDLKNGNGKMRLSTEQSEFSYTFSSRFENGKGTNPEEMIAAAHAGCFSMALANTIALKGYEVGEIVTIAVATLSNPGDGARVTAMDLTTEAKISGIDEETFQILANDAKLNCPVSKTLSTVDIRLSAKLVR